MVLHTDAPDSDVFAGDAARDIIATLQASGAVEVLAALSTPRAASEVVARTPVAHATVNRRINDLADAGLISAADERYTEHEPKPGPRTTFWIRDYRDLTLDFGPHDATHDQPRVIATPESRPPAAADIPSE